MNKNKLKKTKTSANKLDDVSSVLDKDMLLMYKLSNMNGDITDVTVEEKRKLTKE